MQWDPNAGLLIQLYGTCAYIGYKSCRWFCGWNAEEPKIKGQLNRASIFSDWPRLSGIFRGSAPLSDAAGGKSLLLRNWLCPVLGPDGSPLTFLMCQAFFCPSDQSAVVGQAMISARWYISGTNSAWVLLLYSNIKSCSINACKLWHQSLPC